MVWVCDVPVGPVVLSQSLSSLAVEQDPDQTLCSAGESDTLQDPRVLLGEQVIYSKVKKRQSCRLASKYPVMYLGSVFILVAFRGISSQTCFGKWESTLSGPCVTLGLA